MIPFDETMPTTRDFVVEHLSRLEGELEEFVHSHVKPKYDLGCIFMYQELAGVTDH